MGPARFEARGLFLGLAAAFLAALAACGDSRDVWRFGVFAGLLGLGTGLVVSAWRVRRLRQKFGRMLEAEQLRFTQLAERTSDAVLRIRGKDISISPSIENLIGYSAAEVRRTELGRHVHREDLAHVVEAFGTLGTQLRRDVNFRLVHRDGSTVWVDATFFLVRGGDDIEAICTIRDVTRVRREADALRDAMQAARAAQAAADEANEAKGDFLASMSHEIRTPLNAIIGFADLVLAMPDLTTTVRRHVERIRGGGDVLLMIVNDILDLSQAEAGAIRIDPKPFALPLMIDECIALVEPSALTKNLALRVELSDRFPTGMMGDDARLRQVVLNLLNNAIKFTPAGAVTVRIGYDRSRGPNVVAFEISDTGIGIAVEDLPNLFQRFRQVDGTIRRTYGGTGLGLAISKALVERMGGEIGVRSEKGVGSTFWFHVDMAPAPLAVTRSDARTERPTPHLSILLVEDVPINQELATAILRAHGHGVEVVSDGAEAIAAVQAADYDLVLMDVQMPKVDGITATQAIRALGTPSRFVPIVAMTAAVLADQIEAARAAGMDDILSKPLSLPALESLLDRASFDRVRAVPDPDAFDPAALAPLEKVLAPEKIAAMQGLLGASLSQRFTADWSIEGAAALKAEAHASIASAAMLGFLRFAALCRAFIDTTTPESAAAAYAALRRELYSVVLHAMRAGRSGAACRAMPGRDIGNMSRD